MAASLERLNRQNPVIGTRYVVVNIPSAQVEAVEDDRIVKTYKAVVGRRDRPSPLISTYITAVNLNPTWTVPTSIAQKDLLPKIRRDPSWLTRANMRLLDSRGMMVDPSEINWNMLQAQELTFRQDSGGGNALGQIRLDMPNDQAVYLHDTPAKNLFKQNDRFHSSGCIRVEGIKELSSWLLEETSSPQGPWDKQALEKGIASARRVDIRLKYKVPVTFTYLTGYADKEGLVHFRDDVYGLDARDIPAHEKTVNKGKTLLTSQAEQQYPVQRR